VYLWGIELIGIIGFLIYGGTFASRPPAQISFAVGREEIHQVKYVHKEATTETRILVDGEVLLKSDRFWREPCKEEFQIIVGNNELHEVKIKKIRSRFGAFWSGSTLYISVDATELREDQVEFTRGKN